ncbi:MAG: UDP-N-acetylglucosamine 1-carboxyvinyltransferase, partial [Clostridia bacterium]|nr:UDP-N-acetylglucosamine 1-carboxyvinyltransferase [Clostridia bacterium]
MGEIWIEGGYPLSGEVTVQGSKNSVLPMMAAAVLHDGITILHGCPQIADVYAMENILKSLGVETSWEGHSLRLDCSCITGVMISREDAQSMRSSVILLGSMLARKGEIQIAHPGGCTIGARPIDLLLLVLESMGAKICQKDEVLMAVCEKRLQAAEVNFPLSSVGATENGVIAAVLSRGTTRLKNCATEPEIIHLCHFLQALGAEIGGIGTRELWIRGVTALRDAEYTIPPDRIVSGTYLYAAAITRGNIIISNPPLQEMTAVLQVYEKMGGQWESIGGKLRADAGNIKYPINDLSTECYPGFPTDMQSILMAVVLTIPGESHI